MQQEYRIMEIWNCKYVCASDESSLQHIHGKRQSFIELRVGLPAACCYEAVINVFQVVSQ
jgi:hypothetical protein